MNTQKKNIKKKGIFLCRNFGQKEIKRLPKFDYILLIGILHHLTNDQILNLLRNIKKNSQEGWKLNYVRSNIRKTIKIILPDF